MQVDSIYTLEKSSNGFLLKDTKENSWEYRTYKLALSKYLDLGLDQGRDFEELLKNQMLAEKKLKR